MKPSVTIDQLETEFIKLVSLISSSQSARPVIRRSIEEIRDKIERLKAKPKSSEPAPVPGRVPIISYH